MNKVAEILFTLFFLISMPITLSANEKPVIPEQLAPWVDWVLYGHEEKQLCTPAYNNADTIQCDWPSTLDVTVSGKAGSFTQEWMIQHEKKVRLAGNSSNWPHNVEVDRQPAVVLSSGGKPEIFLPPGNHTVTGQFSWQSIPEYLHVPDQTGIISLTINGREIALPVLDQEGRLWLQSQKTKDIKIEDRLKLQCFRLIDDSIPQQMTAYITLDVSGTDREVMLGPVLSTDTSVPLSLESSLPARLEQNGKIRIQVRPGQWYLKVISRHIGPVSQLQYNRPDDPFWPEEEIWSFKSNPSLRTVEVTGVPAIDPLQTALPPAWRNYPAYRITDGDTIRLNEIKRGDPSPAPDQLSLQRNLWLRFDGSGYTIQDSISGKKTSNWRLEMNPPIELGRVALYGQEQFITKLTDTGKSGIEIRNGLLDLTADSQYMGSIFTLPATGWDHDFQKVSARLSLPPGWRLISASGMDTINRTWVKRWTLLDFFIVLIFTIAVARLYSKPLAVLSFVTLVLIYHEPGAPRWIWLSLLAGFTLLRYLPEGRFRFSIKLFQAMNALILIVISIPFTVQQLRTGIYPQLEKPWQSMLLLSGRQQEAPALQTVPSPEEAVTAGSTAGRLLTKAKIGRSIPPEAMINGKGSDSSGAQVAQYDPTMINQTGPGLPSWQWNSYAMSWSGPVQADQEISFILTGPTTNLILSFLRVALLVLLVMGLFHIGIGRTGKSSNNGFRFFLLFPVLLVVFNLPCFSHAGEIPSPQMLDELRTRLLEAEKCFPGCADIGSMNLDINADSLQITLQASTQTEVSVPLPGSSKYWLPKKILINNQEVEALYRSGETLWVLLPPGNHTISLSGRLPRLNTIQLPLPLKPHRVTTTVTGWTVEGIHENGKADSQIQLKRIVDQQNASKQILESGILPPFIRIERTLRLGLNWKIETTVRRISPPGSAVIFDYPLLPGESVLTEGVRVTNRQARINLEAQSSFLYWESVLEKTGEITLKHPETTMWTEIWRADISAIFHVKTAGIPVILHQEGNRWYPTWHPWPNEEVQLLISRPQGVEGQTVTIDKVNLESRPGQRSTDYRLSLSVRSSQGGQHIITLPGNVEVQEVLINGRIQPIRQEKNQVPFPLKPGKQEITIRWIDSQGIETLFRTPDIDLGINSVNDHIDIHLPPSQWPLFMGGPLMGPAVLFWSVVIIIMLVAFGLSRTGLTPLKFHHWFLLGIGMSQSNIISGILVASWLIILELRSRIKADISKISFNIMQIGLAMLTAMALGSLIVAVSQGLLGHPDMNIVGNGSHSTLLRWYADHSSNTLPQAWVISIPMYIYRLAMLSWALWLSFYLISLLKWGWRNFTEPVIWRKIPRKKKSPKIKKGQSTQGTGSSNEGDAARQQPPVK